MRNVVALGSGLVFALGLALSGMTQPARVVGFLDVTGRWDPTLAFVMGGAIAVYAAAARWRSRRARPVFAPAFAPVARTKIDRRLVAGATIFGAGWGLAGFCPGPALASIGAGSSPALLFVPAMLAGMFIVHTLIRVRAVYTTTVERSTT